MRYNRGMIEGRSFVIPSAILGVCLVGGLWILGTYIASRNANSTISVTGSATQDVRADTATWRIDITRSAYQEGTAAAYAQVVRDAGLVQSYLAAQQFASSTITASAVSTDRDYSKDQNAPTTYVIREQLILQTSDVDKVDQFSRKLSDISGKVAAGTIVSPSQPEYYISSLPTLRVSLLGKAVQDAKARAVQIAQSGGTTVGALQSASSGVVQVMAPNSINVEDYGSYDTSTIEKQVMVTARVIFYVK